jgi:RNA polymerase sigma-70 factor, ECF subfamily
VSASNRTILQSMLVSDYDALLRKLTRQFGSPDFAAETLHETFAKLDRVADTSVLLRPKDYLFRILINVGKNRRRAERLRATAAEIDAVLQVADDTPDPAQIIESRSEMDALLAVLSEMSPRTRAAFRAALFEGKPYAKIASDLGVSLRTVERDLQYAIEFCARSLGRSMASRSSDKVRKHDGN